MIAGRGMDHAHSEPAGSDRHLDAAIGWLRRAQDVTGDGGVSWGYHLRRGWSPSYPETTGYLIPTFLELAATGHGSDLRGRAERGIAFLAGVQLESGAFPADPVGAARRPSVFNTGQVICGLTAWYRVSRDERVRSMVCAAADWLVSVQDDDGAWRSHGYLEYPVTYTAHASCWIAELGELIGDKRFTAAAAAHLDWVLRQQDPVSGWFERCGFSALDHAARRAVTHTLAYTLWGTLHSAIILNRGDAIDAVRRPARMAANIAEARGWLPGVIDAGWTSESGFACLTGNAQMAILWLRLRDLGIDDGMVAAADIVLARVAAAQRLGSSISPGARGGIPGSDPVWGDYIPFAFPNWAVKFYIDALLARRRAVSGAERAE